MGKHKRQLDNIASYKNENLFPLFSQCIVQRFSTIKQKEKIVLSWNIKCDCITKENAFISGLTLRSIICKQRWIALVHMQQWANQIFLQKSTTEIEDVYLNYKNDHQRKDVNIETNSFDHNKGVWRQV